MTYAVFRSSVLRIVSCCIRRADAEAQDALLNNLLRLLRERGAGRNYSMLAAALGVIRNESPLLSAIANEPEPLNSIVRIGAGTITTTADMLSEPPILLTLQNWIWWWHYLP